MVPTITAANGRRGGFEVWSGMILGFDHDDVGIFEAHKAFLREARIASAMVSILAAIPKTPLYARLAAEGRLDESEAPISGTNVIPRRMTSEESSTSKVAAVIRIIRGASVGSTTSS
jgi:hypothetical protein